MPRAVDTQQLLWNHDPTRSGTEFHLSSFQQIDDLIAQILAGLLDSFKNLIIPALEEFLGIDLSLLRPLLDALSLDFSSPAAFFTSIIEALIALPEILIVLLTSLIEALLSLDAEELFNSLLTELVTLLVSLPDLLGTLLEAVLNLLESFTGVDLGVFLPLWHGLDFSNPVAFFYSLANALVATGTGLLGVDSLLGLVPFFNTNSALPIIGAGQLQDVVQNLLMNPYFENIASFVPGAGIIWDGLTKHSATGGSALFTPDGSAKSLIGNAISVLPGDVLDLSIWTKWTGLTGSGPISLMLNAYDADDNLLSGATQVIAAVAMPGLTGSWTNLFGSYTVPAGMGVTSIAASFNVSSLLNGGSVWFDDGSITKPNLMPANAITGPGGMLDNLPDEWTLLFDTLGDQASASISDIENRLADMLNNLSALNASNILSGNIATDYITDLQANFNNLVQQLLGWAAPPAGSWYAPTDSASALGTQADTVLGHGGILSQHGATLSDYLSNFTNLFSRVTTLETAGGGTAGPPPTGGSVSDDFERSGTLGSNWNNSDSSYQLDGHSAYWNQSTYSARTATCIYVTGSATDYQIINIVIGNSAPTYSGSYYGWNYVHGRVSGAVPGCTFAMRADGYWEFRTSGVVASGTTTKLGIGSNMTLYCGDKLTSTVNKFTCTVNNATIWQGTGTTSTGSVNRGWGFGSGMNGTGTVFFGQVGFGGKVNQWSAADQ